MDILIAKLLKGSLDESHRLRDDVNDGIINGQARFLDLQAEYLDDAIMAIEEMNFGKARSIIIFVLENFEDEKKSSARLLSQNVKDRIKDRVKEVE